MSVFRKVFVELGGVWVDVSRVVGGDGFSEVFWRGLDGCRLRYRKSPVVFRCDDPYWSLLAEYVNCDGNLTKDSGVLFSMRRG